MTSNNINGVNGICFKLKKKEFDVYKFFVTFDNACTLHRDYLWI